MCAADSHLAAVNIRTMVTTWDVPTGPAEGPDEEDESGSNLAKRDLHDASGERPSRTPTAAGAVPLLKRHRQNADHDH
jgi:hypothetical protein|eukprot:COSAG02_NODE_3430_length_6758_cov_386.535816_3_plen_78_part_00